MVDGLYTLMGMSLSGETCIARDDIGRVWLMSIYAPNEEIDAAAVSRIIAYNGWEPLDLDFDSWDELARYRREHSVPSRLDLPEFADYDASDVAAALRESQTATSPSQIALAREVLLSIVEHSDVLSSDRALLKQVTKRLRELDEIRPATATLRMVFNISPAGMLDAMDRYQAA